NLCAEEYYLYRKGYIEPTVWAIWEMELRRMLASDLIVREWQVLEAEFRSYPDFQQYVSTLETGRRGTSNSPTATTGQLPAPSTTASP
ncbi:hypothetical protein NL533_31260, partial [Klebsiella pneumoniae]|nr:hypothetical protein [Klebsiella pneumoniae]